MSKSECQCPTYPTGPFQHSALLAFGLASRSSTFRGDCRNLSETFSLPAPDQERGDFFFSGSFRLSFRIDYQSLSLTKPCAGLAFWSTQYRLILLKILLSQNIHPPCLVSSLTLPAHDGQESSLVSAARNFLIVGIFS